MFCIVSNSQLQYKIPPCRNCFEGIFLYRYTVYDLIAEGLYQVTLDIDLCLETNGPCTLETTVFKNTLLPKKVCKLYSGFVNASKYVVAKSIIEIVEMTCRKIQP